MCSGRIRPAHTGGRRGSEDRPPDLTLVGSWPLLLIGLRGAPFGIDTGNRAVVRLRLPLQLVRGGVAVARRIGRDFATEQPAEDSGQSHLPSMR